MPSDAEGRAVLVAEDAVDQQHDAHHLAGLLAGGHFKRIDLGGEADGRQRGVVAPSGVELSGVEAMDRGRQVTLHLLQFRRRLSETQRARRQGAVGLLAGGGLDEGLRAIEGVGGDAEPGRRPVDVRRRQHRLRGDLGERFGKDLRRVARRFQVEAVRAGAAHAERIPHHGAIDRAVGVVGDHHHDLVGTRRVRRAPGGGEDGVGIVAVGNDDGFLGKLEAAVLDLDGADGVAQVAADAGFGSG